MSRSHRLALVGVALAVAGAAGTAAAETKVEVRNLTLPVRDLDLEQSSIDRSVRRVEDPSGVRVTLAADVLFAFNRARPISRARSRIGEVASEIRPRDPSRVSVLGYTDSKGGPGFNLRLSRRRAQAVSRLLKRATGRTGPTIAVRGRGESDPVVSNTNKDGSDNPRGRARNRRVEIRIPRGG